VTLTFDIGSWVLHATFCTCVLWWSHDPTYFEMSSGMKVIYIRQYTVCKHIHVHKCTKPTPGMGNCMCMTSILTHYCMSTFRKMTVFIEKSPVSSSNCYKTIQTALILIKLGTNVDWTIDFVTTCSVLNFLLLWQRVDISKLPKVTILRRVFPSKLISKCCNFSMD
jgi:hypothetical protein